MESAQLTDEPASLPTNNEKPSIAEKPSHDSILHNNSDSDTITAAPRTQIPRPSLYFAHFVDHRTHFIRFLEAVADHRWGQRITLDQNTSSSLGTSTKPKSYDPDERDDQTAIWNTLLELYLSAALDSANSPTPSGSPATDSTQLIATEAELKQRAMHVLRNEGSLPYDPTHALIVCSTHSFTDGLVLLWEKMGMYEEVLRFWMDEELHPERSIATSGLAPVSIVGGTEKKTASASQRVIECLDNYGPQHPHLYTLVLRFLTSSPALLSRHAEDLKRLLDVVDRERYIPPLGVVQILSRNDVASIGLVKEWLLRRITESREGIEAVSCSYLILHNIENMLMVARSISCLCNMFW